MAALALIAAVAPAAQRWRHRAQRLSRPAPPVRFVTLDNPVGFWIAHGYVEMTPPLRPPTSEDLETRIVVYLKLPPHGVITTQFIPALRRHALLYPQGTCAERAEYFAHAALDA